MVEPPIVLSRKVARIFGLDIAAVAQQFVYWTLNPKCSLSGKVDEDGSKWVHFTTDQLADEFDWVSRSTIKRIVGVLEGCGFLLSRQPDKYAAKEYRVSQGILEAIETGKLDRLDESTGRLIAPPLDQNEPLLSMDQIEPCVVDQIEPRAMDQIEPTPYNSIPKSLPKPLASGSAKPRKERPRDALMDALASVESDDLSTFNKAEWSRIAKAKQTLLESKPDASPDDVKRLRLAYIKAFPKASITAMALVNNFSKLWASANLQAAKPTHKELLHNALYG